MNTESIILGVFLILGSIISTIPQHVKILKLKSTVGMSFLWMFLGNINQFSAVMNAAVMKFPQVQACVVVGVGDCLPSLLALFQLAGLWIFTFPMYIWYLKFTDLTTVDRREWFWARLFFGILCAFVLATMLIATITLHFFGDCAYFTLVFGYSMGMLSTIVTFIQWSPQIYKTFVNKSVGSFSILMLLIQAPGSIIIVYFLIFISHEGVSTWLSFVSSTIQQIILLVLLIYYDRKDKKAQAMRKGYLQTPQDSSLSTMPPSDEGEDQPLLAKKF